MTEPSSPDPRASWLDLELPSAAPLPACIHPQGVEPLLVEAAAGDPQRLAQLAARVEAGEPAAYVAGFLRFRGRRFRSDPRAYITDPELTHLVDVLLRVGDALSADGPGPLRVLDFGVGAGTLGISVAHERPGWSVYGIDIDPEALALAAENVAMHPCRIALAQSDQLVHWPEAWAAPDLIFADPPWGSEADLYADAGRDAAYYHRMPAASAYPRGGRTAIHDELIRQVAARGWRSTLVLNYGVLPVEVIERSASRCRPRRIVEPVPGMSVLIARTDAPDPGGPDPGGSAANAAG